MTIIAQTAKAEINWPHYRETLAEQSALWADQYALTMSQALFSEGRHDINTTFHAYIRKNPFEGGYLLTAGQNIVFEWLKDNWKFDEIDIALLKEEKVQNPKTGEMTPLYSDEFLDMLADSKFELTVDAMPEGEIAFPDEPIMRVNGPVWQCLMLEACVLNAINSQSLFATLGSRIKAAAQGDTVIELGLRRAQSLGGLEATRGSYIGGVNGTSNMLAKKYYGIPSVGTMAHAYVMFHETEKEAFTTWATHMPNNGSYLVDTYDTANGIKNAVAACQETGATLKGIRLDSGDLSGLSKAGRETMDQGGFEKGSIVASNDLDVPSILQLKEQGSKINVWGVGTNLVTSKEQPALGAVYKLAAVFDYHKQISQEELDALKSGVQEGIVEAKELASHVRETIKLSGDAIKVSIPGEMEVIRHLRKTAEGAFVFNGDTIVDNLQKRKVDEETLTGEIVSVVKNNAAQQVIFGAGSIAYQPLQRFFEKGQLTGEIETVHQARTRAQERLAMLDENSRQLSSPAPYFVGLEKSLYEKRQRKILNNAIPKYAA